MDLVEKLMDQKTYLLALAGGGFSIATAFIAGAIIPYGNALWVMMSFGGAIPVSQAMNELVVLANQVTGNLLVNFIALSFATLIGVTIVLPFLGKPVLSLLGVKK